MRDGAKDTVEKLRGTSLGNKSCLFFFSIFFRQCALAALKDVHEYLSHEEGRVAVKKFAFSLGFLLGWTTANMY